MTDNTQSSASKAELPEEVAASIAKLEKEAAFIIGTPGCREAYAAMTDAITLLSALASRAQTAEAVAAKSREEVIEAAACIADTYSEESFRLAGDTVLHDPFLRGDHTEEAYAKSTTLQLEGAGHAYSAHCAKHIAEAIRALKSSRTDSGQPPATNAVESGRATEDDGATKSGAMISASPVAGKGNG